MDTHVTVKKILLGNIFTNMDFLYIYMLWFEFSFGAKFFKLFQFLFSFVVYSLP